MKKIIMLLLLAGIATDLHATMPENNKGRGGPLGKPAVLPNTQVRVHDVGKVWLSVTNFGFFGSQDGAFPDASGKYLIAPDCEFPGGSNLDYLFQGSLWIGAEVDTVDNLGHPILDTLVSIGNDGWWGDLMEMFPDIPPGGAIEVRSTRPTETYPYGDTIGAKSEQDYIATYSDTFTASSFVNPDPNDQRPHLPLYIGITQKSYAWSYEYAEDFVLFDFDITNVGDRILKNLWVGMYIDADVAHTSESGYGAEEGAQDDICGFDSMYIVIDGNDTTQNRINTAWIADNNGQPYNGAYEYRSPLGVSGVRVVRTPLPESLLNTGFNWWISNTDASKDWGPRRLENGTDPYPGGGMGTPGGDKAKYKVMSNHEFDYDQIWCAIPRTGWIEPPSTRTDLANGYDTRYLFSFGPFPLIVPGDTLKLTTAYICGEDLHSNPSNYDDNLKDNTEDSASVMTFYSQLNFLDFATNSQWADWVYDNPGVDTGEEPYEDSNGNGQYDEGEWFDDLNGDGVKNYGDGDRGEFRLTPEGDTFWYKGDGIPDFAGPPPPPAPAMTLETSRNTVTVKWDGKRTEKLADTFSRKIDFEGYRIYKSATGRSDDFTLVSDYDIEDYDFTWYDITRNPAQWVIWKKAPIKGDIFRQVHGDGWDPARDTTIEVQGQTQVGHWTAHGWNRGLGAIQESISDTTYRLTLNNLSESDGVYITVTAYDYGDPVTKLSSLECSPSINAKLVYPIQQGGVGGKVAVYPNPYRITDSEKVGGYVDLGREDSDRSGNTQFDRRILFSGLPRNWTIRIFTLDGDLVKQINEGDRPYQLSEGICYWDLISRNTQAVVSGVYIFVVEGENGYHELGKLAIIK